MVRDLEYMVIGNVNFVEHLGVTNARGKCNNAISSTSRLLG